MDMRLLWQLRILKCNLRHHPSNLRYILHFHILIMLWHNQRILILKFRWSLFFSELNILLWQQLQRKPNMNHMILSFWLSNLLTSWLMLDMIFLSIIWHSFCLMSWLWVSNSWLWILHWSWQQIHSLPIRMFLLQFRIYHCAQGLKPSLKQKLRICEHLRIRRISFRI